MSEEDKYSKSMKQIKSELKTNTVYFFNIYIVLTVYQKLIKIYKTHN